jgi:hypothetical protein
MSERIAPISTPRDLITSFTGIDPGPPPPAPAPADAFDAAVQTGIANGTERAPLAEGSALYHTVEPAAIGLDLLADGIELAHESRMGVGSVGQGMMRAAPAIMVVESVWTFGIGAFQHAHEAREAGKNEGRRMEHQEAFGDGVASRLYPGDQTCPTAPPNDTAEYMSYLEGQQYADALPPGDQQALRTGIEQYNDRNHGYVPTCDTAAHVLDLAQQYGMTAREWE